jgi:biotin carboxyl carrier protein
MSKHTAIQLPTPAPTEQALANPNTGLANRQRAAYVALRRLAQAWLYWQCQMLAGTSLGELYAVAPDDAALSTVARWPVEIGTVPELMALARESAHSGQHRLAACRPYGQPVLGIADLLACPVIDDGRVIAVIVVAVTPRTEVQQRALLQLLQWGSLGLIATLRCWPDRTTHHVANLRAAVDVIANQRDFTVAANLIVRHIAAGFDCDTVSLGLREHLSMSTVAVSSARQVNRRATLIQDLEAAMVEAADQGTTVHYPVVDPATQPIARAHEDYALRYGIGACCTVLLKHGGTCFGALTLDRTGRGAFTQQAIQDLQTYAELLGPILYLKHRDQRSLVAKVAEGCRAGLHDTLIATPRKSKLLALALLAVGAALGLTDTDYRVTAPSRIEGASQRAIVAPLTSYIAAVNARPGDIVRAGAVLLSLDARDLSLAQTKARLEREKHVKEYRLALAQGDRAQVSILAARIAQAETELRLVEEQLQRAELRAPFDGVIVEGDLSQSLGAPVERGSVLFEIAQMDDYRVVIEVDEHDIGAIQGGQSGNLWLSALPAQPLAFAVERIMPVAAAADGRNYFRVEARLEQSGTRVLPGMQGIAKIQAGQRSRLWVLTHALQDRLLIAWWSFGL